MRTIRSVSMVNADVVRVEFADPRESETTTEDFRIADWAIVEMLEIMRQMGQLR